MNRSSNLITGIDIGTNAIKIISAKKDTNGNITVLASSAHNSSGIKNGYIIDKKSASTSINRALDEITSKIGMRPSTAYLSISGISLSSIISDGTAYIRNSESTITQKDMNRAISKASQKADQKLINKKIIHDIPLYTYIDDEKALCNPVGLQASKIDNTIMIVNALESHIEDFIGVLDNMHIDIIDVTANPIASSYATLTNPQKMQGCVLVDLGFETTSIIIYENNIPIHLEVLPMGSNDITNAIAIELKIDRSEAEQLKKNILSNTQYNKKNINKIINKKLTQIFNAVKSSINTGANDILLPSGILITGGGSRIDNIEQISKDILKLPTKKVYPTNKVINNMPEMSVAYGLCVWGSNNSNDKDTVKSKLKNILSKIHLWFEQFIP